MKNWKTILSSDPKDFPIVVDNPDGSGYIGIASCRDAKTAKLMSAAPDLLEACESILHSMAHEGVAHGGRVAESVNQLQQAINKAKS